MKPRNGQSWGPMKRVRDKPAPLPYPKSSRAVRSPRSGNAPPKNVSILQAMDHPQIWGPMFQSDDWKPWKTFLRSVFCLEMSNEDLALYKECTGRTEPPETVEEVWAIVGRRGGKSRIFACIAAYIAIFRDYSQYLAPGEVGYVKIVCPDRKQSRLVRDYCEAFLKACPTLARFVVSDDDDTIRLSNNIAIEVQTASIKSSRGYTCVGFIIDEGAHLPVTDESKNQDSEILAAVRPSMTTIPNALLLVGSSPYAKRGELWENYRRYYGKDSEILVWKAPTRVMHPSITQAWIDRQIERDPAKNTAEYMAEFRSDIEGYVSPEVVRAAIMPGRVELLPKQGVRYFGFTDMAGGSGQDSGTLAIAHKSVEGVVVLDCLRERRPPFSPTSVVYEFSQTLRDYGIHRVTGDHWGGEFPPEAFKKQGIRLQPAERACAARSCR
jgi:hypothetical protein